MLRMVATAAWWRTARRSSPLCSGMGCSAHCTGAANGSTSMIGTADLGLGNARCRRGGGLFGA